MPVVSPDVIEQRELELLDVHVDESNVPCDWPFLSCENDVEWAMIAPVCDHIIGHLCEEHRARIVELTFGKGYTSACPHCWMPHASDDITFRPI